MIQNLIVGILALILVGCGTLHTKAAKFPDAPEELKEECSDLTPHTENDGKLTSTITIVVENYSKYYQCAEKQKGWIEWYNKQKEINNEINKK